MDDRECSQKKDQSPDVSTNQIENTDDDSDIVQTPQASITPLQPLEDITLRMSLNVRHNLETSLEELSKLRRLGHFMTAFHELDERIAPFLKNRYVLVQYGQLLMEGKRYEELLKLANQYPPNETQSMVELNWKALLKRTGALTDMDFGKIENTQILLKRTNIVESLSQITSTELNALLLLWNPSLWLSDGSKPSWHSIYKHLYDKRRVWEMRDLLTTLLFYESPSVVLARFTPQTEYSIKSEKPPYQSLYDDLHTAFQDQSSTLALLDIFTSISFSYMNHPNSRQQIDDCLRIGRDCASKSLSYNTQNLKSRPYLRFLIAEVRSKSYDGTGAYYEKIVFRGTRRGKVLEFSTIFPELSVPIYAPINDETPQWKPQLKAETLESISTISLVLKAAQELDDFELQAGCLLELIYHETKNTKAIVARLQKLLLQKCDHFYYRNLLLFSYMLTQSPNERKTLRADILLHGEYFSASIEPQMTRYRILASLAPTRQERDIYTQRAESTARQKYSDAVSLSPSHNLRPLHFQSRYEGMNHDRAHNNQSYIINLWEAALMRCREPTRWDGRRSFVSSAAPEETRQRQRPKTDSVNRNWRMTTDDYEPGTSRVKHYTMSSPKANTRRDNKDIINKGSAVNETKDKDESRKTTEITNNLVHVP